LERSFTARLLVDEVSGFNASVTVTCAADNTCALDGTYSFSKNDED